MIIIIDGYNVLKQASRSDYVSETQKMQFIKQLGIYAKHKGHKIVLVFDGGSFEWPHKDRVHGIYVIHVGCKETADEYIKRYVKSFRENDLLLVSTDRALGRVAHALGVSSLDAQDFYLILKDEIQATGLKNIPREDKAVKLTDEELEEIDQLMQEVDRVQTKTDDLMSPERIMPRKQQLSKSEKKMMQKLKKL